MRSHQLARAAFAVVLCAAALAGNAAVAHAVTPNGPDLEFILEQIKRAEAHAAGGDLLGTGPNQVPGPLLPFGLRTVNGEFNNLVRGQEKWGSADRVFPRLTDPVFRPAGVWDPDGPAPGSTPPTSTSYAQKSGVVADTEPRVISNLIVDQSTGNPAAAEAAANTPNSEESGGQFFIPNRAPDTGLSAPFNSWFTLFGQFFDHGLDLTTKGKSGTVIVPLKPDDPLYVPGSHTNFMVLTRSTNQAGPDTVIGTDDDIQNATNTTTPFVDQNQTYTSHPSHQVFLREYELSGGRPVANGRLLDRPTIGGLARWADVKAQARAMLGIALDDQDVLNLPLVKTDQYGRFVPDPVTGFAQIVTDAEPLTFDSGTPAAPVDASSAVRTGHAFLDDIAHHAAPFGDHDFNPATPHQPLTPDTTAGTNDDHDPATYDDELLDAHFITGDGRGNENIGLTTVHHVFHAEHNLRVGEIIDLIEEPGAPEPADWQLPSGEWSGERLFQAARFITEMEYQHLVFEEFARKVQPQVNVFAGYNSNIDPAIVAEFAHTVYRFGHSMLTETVARKNADGTDNDIGLIEAFLNPLEFNDGGSAGQLSPRAAAGSVVRGMTAQVGNEIDEFVTGALRNNLVGLPLDLATINIARGREAGVPSLNVARRQFFEETNDSALRPYESWNDFKASLKHEASLVNFVAAYGTHATITGAPTVAAKRTAAQALVDADSAFLDEDAATSGVDAIDFWIGGLAERQMPFGGMLGSSFNFVFETQMEKLQDGDRFYYLSRTSALNFLTQLEENSFAELVMRTTDATHLPFDIFSTPDFTFEIERLGDSGPVDDDPQTDYDESALLTRNANGTLRFNGGEHVVFGGTGGNDRVHSSEGDDTLWGDGGHDRLEGGAGNDALSGADGDDILTDLFGDDNIKGGKGNDAINGGQGFDLLLGGLGNDFVVAGSDPKETFAGAGDDFVIAGDSSDVVFANEGDDWVEGGGQADELNADNGDPFEETGTGHDVVSGDGGDDELHGEGGDDILVKGHGVERMEGMSGFDWVTYRGHPLGADADMNRNLFLPPNQLDLRDRFGFVEGLSGYNRNDILRGDDLTAPEMLGQELTDPSRVSGLAGLLGGAATFTGGNILLGGNGHDLVEGRGGNDVIDGDAWLNARISVREAGNPANEIGNVGSMEDIRNDVFNGTINPGQLRIVRSIEPGTAGPEVIDTAVFSDPRANYDVSPALSTSEMTVNHARGTAIDGSDTVRNVERLAFADETVEVEPIAGNGPATGEVDISDVTPEEDGELTARRAFDDPDGVDEPTIDYAWQAETAPGVWVTLTSGVTFTPGDAEALQRLRVVATFRDNDGVFEIVRSVPTGPVGNVNDAPTGRPTLNNAAPRQGETVTALTSSIADLDGLAGVTFTYQWQERVDGLVPRARDIAGAQAASFAPGSDQLGTNVRVLVSFVDGGRTRESIASAWTSDVAAVPGEPAILPPGLGQVPDPAAAEVPAAPARPRPGNAPVVRPRSPLKVAALSIPKVVAFGRPLTIGVKLPGGTRAVRIKVYRLGAQAAKRRATAPGWVATLHRKVRKGGWHRFRLTERKVRRLKPGRYAIEVRAGRSRATLGPASRAPVTVSKAPAAAKPLKRRT